MKKIILCSGKGGVGKSIIAASLSLALSRRGIKVALADLDTSKPSIPLILKAENVNIKVKNDRFVPAIYNGIEVISSGFNFSNHALWTLTKHPKTEAYLLFDLTNFNADICIIDTPPLPFDQGVFKLPLDGAVIVTTLNRLDIEGSKYIFPLLKENEIPVLGFILNRCTNIKSVRVGGGKIRWEVGKHIRASFPILGRIPESPRISRTMLVDGIGPIADKVLKVIRHPTRLKREPKFCPVVNGECMGAKCIFWLGDRCGKGDKI